MDAYLGSLITEQINEKTKHIDNSNTIEILQLINLEDTLVPQAVKDELGNIGRAVDAVVERIKRGGRVFYIGAGTSGRIGIIDASECPPTFGTDPELFQGIIAGGDEAIRKSIEGAEDNENQGRSIIHEKNVSNRDVVVGIAASGRTPFVIGAIREAKKIGAVTIAVSNNTDSRIKEESDIAITPMVGPEVIMGSTRMKAATAQKLVLNMISTASMIKLGKVYGNLMVDVQPTNDKLVDRAIRIIMHATGADKDEAEKFLQLSGSKPKTAIVMYKTGVDRILAEKYLNDAHGFVSRAIGLHGESSC